MIRKNAAKNTWVLLPLPSAEFVFVSISIILLRLESLKHGSSGSMLMLIDVRLTRSKKDGGHKAAYLQGSQVMQVDEGHAGG